MWVCGTWGVNFGHDNTLDNNSIWECIHQLDPLGMNIQFPRMLFFVAKLQAGQPGDLYENQIPHNKDVYQQPSYVGTNLVPFFTNSSTISLYYYQITILLS